MTTVKPVTDADKIAFALAEFSDSPDDLRVRRERIKARHLPLSDDLKKAPDGMVQKVIGFILGEGDHPAKAIFLTRQAEIEKEKPVFFSGDSDFAGDPGYEIPKEDDVTVGVIVTEADSDDALANMLTGDSPPEVVPTKPKKKEKVFTCPKVINFSKAESTQKIKIPSHIPFELEGEVALDGIRVKQIGEELELKVVKSFKGEKEIRVLGKEVGNTVFGIKIRCTYTAKQGLFSRLFSWRWGRKK